MLRYVWAPFGRPSSFEVVAEPSGSFQVSKCSRAEVHGAHERGSSRYQIDYEYRIRIMRGYGRMEVFVTH